MKHSQPHNWSQPKKLFPKLFTNVNIHGIVMARCLGEKGRYLPALPLELHWTKPQPSQLTFHYCKADDTQHILKNTNNTSQTSLWSHSKNANPRIYLDHWISFGRGPKLSMELCKHQNLTRKCTEKYFLIPSISPVCKFKKNFG